MTWTQKHSRNAVAKKERLRMDRAVAKPADETQSCYKPRKSSPDFTINIRTARGERMQISVWRINGRVVLSDGIKSVRQLCRGIEHLITKSA
jgi:hypothetical protein